MKSHQISSRSTGQQKSCKLVARPPKILKNVPKNHEKSNFCESWFLQYLPWQMLVFPIPDIQIRTQIPPEKATWRQACTNTFFRPEYLQSFQMESLNPPEMTDNPSMDLKVSSAVSQDRPRVPKDAKVRPPSMPNDGSG